MFRNLCSISLLSLLLLTACSTSPSPGNQISANADIRGQVPSWTEGDARLSSFFYAEAEASVVSGEVLASGEFGIDLKNTVAANLLEPVPSCEGLKVSDIEAKTNQFSGVDALKGSQRVGLLAFVSSITVMSDGLTGVGDFYVQYIYADKAVTLQGDCPLGGVPGIFRYDLDLKSGWNTAVFTLLDEQNGVQTLELSSKAVPAGANWFYAE